MVRDGGGAVGFVRPSLGVMMCATILNKANENPWYVLLTLHGEQEGKWVDNKLTTKNRQVWNNWSCRGMEPDEKRDVAVLLGMSVRELESGGLTRPDLEYLHKQEMLRRNGPEFEYPGLPSEKATYDLTRIRFPVTLSIEKYVFRGLLDFLENDFEGDFFAESAVFLAASNHLRCNFRKRVNFSRTRFLGPAEFMSSEFIGSATFHQAKFGSSANFTSTIFRDKADFEAAAFSGFTHFQEAEFYARNDADKRSISFADCIFERPANFQRAKFVYKYPNYSATVFHDITSFTANSENWPSQKPVDLGQAKAACGKVRHLLAKQGLAEEEHVFYRREMEFAGQSGSWLQRPLYWVFGWLSDFGYAILTPFLWMVLVIGVGAWAFAFGMSATTQVLGFGEALGVSFSNVFNFLGFHRTFLPSNLTQTLPQWLKVVSAFQTILGVILLFFLGLGLRTRFRLR